MTILTSGPGAAPVCLLLCLSHLRWDLVFQRPHHLLTRAARDFDVVYVEEPLTEAGVTPQLRRRRDKSGVTVVTPVLPDTLSPDRAVGQAARDAVLRRLLDAFLARRGHDRLFLWYYTPMALAWTFFAGWAAWVEFHPESWAHWGLVITSVYLLLVGIVQQLVPVRGAD